MFHPLAIARLIESGFSIWFPLNGSSNLYIKSSDLSSLSSPIQCKIILASRALKENPVARVNNTKEAIVVIDPVIETVWFFPAGYCEDRINIRLGEKTEEFVLPEPASLSFLEQKEARSSRLTKLKDQAKQMILENQDHEH